MISLREKFAHIKFNKKSKVALLTHTDMDGSGSSILLRHFFGKNLILVKYFTNYGMDKGIKDTVENETLMESIDVLFITDISCSIETAIYIANSKYANKIILLDHHPTAKKLNAFPFAYVEEEVKDASFDHLIYKEKLHTYDGSITTSGTTLMLDFLISKGFYPKSKLVLELAHTIGAYDSWSWSKVFDNAKEYSNLNTLFAIYEQEKFEKVFVKKLKKGEKTLFGKTENLLLELEESKIENYVSTKSKLFETFYISIDERNYFAIFANVDRYYSNIFDKMMELYPNAELLIANNSGKISLRTRKDDVNVSEIAQKVGGGGHVQAAGFSMFEENKFAFFSAFETKLGAKISFIEKN